MSRSRNLGLDVVRSIAILLVVGDHAIQTTGPATTVPVLTVFFSGYFGVELFFALSGFLIGRLLIDLPTGPGAWSATRRFWVRRWFRTLPAYYVYFLFFALVQPPINFATAFFLQRFFPEPRSFFTVAWSLAMEEWFYFLFPILALGLGMLLPRLSRRRIVLITSLFIIIGCCAARYIANKLGLDWPILLGELTFVHHPIMRLDCCAYGVVLAALVEGDASWIPRLIRRLTPSGSLLLSLLPVVLSGTLFILLVRPDAALHKQIGFAAWGIYYFVFSYPLMDIGATVMVAIAFFASPALPPRLAAVIELLSRCSYSLYLGHTLGNFLWIYPLFAWLGMTGGLAVHLALALMLAIASYFCIELPFLRLRDRWFPAPPDAELLMAH